MNQDRINRNSVIIETIKDICDTCKTCEVSAINRDNGEVVKVTARYCNDGSGYIDINMYDERGQYLDCCKLKHPTDSCILPFNLEIDTFPDCGCE